MGRNKVIVKLAFIKGCLNELCAGQFNVIISFVCLQCSYSCLSFLKVLWPEFSVWDFYGAILSFQWNYKTFKVRKCSITKCLMTEN